MRAVVIGAVLPVLFWPAALGARDLTTVRTESFPRPPYSGATYYVYERAGRTICTKLSVCNKFNDCTVTYRPGVYREDEDAATGAPYATTPAVPISSASQSKHVCLTRFGLAGR